MRRNILYFSHANGFPAACYRKFFSYLEPDFRISSITCIGHDPVYPVTDGWPHLVAQLIDHLSAHCRAPVVGVGHSLGGYLTFMAAVQRPELFNCIILLDAPILGYFKVRRSRCSNAWAWPIASPLPMPRASGGATGRRWRR
jgi:pimeloyl-ACP methyl ester carboxylesterase